MGWRLVIAVGGCWNISVESTTKTEITTPICGDLLAATIAKRVTEIAVVEIAVEIARW